MLATLITAAVAFEVESDRFKAGAPVDVCGGMDVLGVGGAAGTGAFFAEQGCGTIVNLVTPAAESTTVQAKSPIRTSSPLESGFRSVAN